MQERRTSIRIPLDLTLQYCDSETQAVKDGRLENLSERGVGWISRDAFCADQRVSLTFTLPDGSEPITATGVVRWARASIPPQAWRSIGMEWILAEDASRQHLRRFLGERLSARSDGEGSAHELLAHRAWWRATIAGWIVLVSLGAWMWLVMARERAQFAVDLSQRNAVIIGLKRQTLELDQQLADADSRLGATTGEVEQLDRQTQTLEEDFVRLSDDLAHMQRAHGTVIRDRERLLTEREELMRQILTLEQERLRLGKRLAFDQELHLAIREAIEARMPSPLLGDRIDERVQGNQGFLFRDGRATMIRVLAPEVAD